MSSLWLALSLVGTFLAIFLIGVVVDIAMRERNRPVALLQSQVTDVESNLATFEAALDEALAESGP